MNRVVVTGIEAITPFGVGVDCLDSGMRAGRSAIVEIDSMLSEFGFPVKGFPVRCAGLIPKDVYPPIVKGRYSLEVEMIVHRLLGQYLAGGKDWYPVDAIIFGTNFGIAKFSEIERFHSKRDGFDSCGTYPEHGMNFLLKELKRFGQHELNPTQTVVCANGCITGLAALSYGWQRIRSGRNKRVLVVCDETRVRPEELLKYNALGALSRQIVDVSTASRPFSRERLGFVKGEGAGLVFLEDSREAKRRGVRELACIEGYGQTSDAYRLTDGREDSGGIAAAIEKAIAGAGLKLSDIDYVNAHGTGTVKNDIQETKGIKTVFGKRAYEIPISSLKSQIGHLNYACGIVEFIACVKMFEGQYIAPTINYVAGDPLCDLDYVPNEIRSCKLRCILKNSFGFGGSNAALVLSFQG